MRMRNGTLKQARSAVRLSRRDQERIERALKDEGYAQRQYVHSSLVGAV